MAQTTEELGRKLKTSKDLGSVVGTMKALAAVNIRQFEQAAQALGVYYRTVELGLRALLRSRPGFLSGVRRDVGGNVAAIIIGSDQGMCGSLNEQVAGLALSSLSEASQRQPAIMALGERLVPHLEDAGLEVGILYNLPGSVAGIGETVREILLAIDTWQQDGQALKLLVFHARQNEGAIFTPVMAEVLPLDKGWLQELASQSRPTNQLPLIASEWNSTFSALARQYLLVSLYRALADSLASENASRLAAMQGAERNIEDRVSELTQAFNQARQRSITEELLDITSGFEALRDEV